MKVFYLVSFIIFATPVYSDNRPFIISGYDDVLRQAENTGLLKATLKILEDDRTFTGMPELYSSITVKEKNPKFVLVSAISHLFDSRIENFLHAESYPAHKRYLRNWITDWSIKKFKVGTIDKIISERPDRFFIVILDNSDPSLELAEQLQVKLSTTIKAIYLRQVARKKLPEKAIPFYTAFDIAINEFRSGRLDSTEVQKIGNTILSEENVSNLFPDYAICPKDYDPCRGNEPAIGEVCSNLLRHVRKMCTLL